MARKIETKEKISFGNKLREVRETLGMQRNVFARETKTDVTYYTRVEEGAILPDYLFLKKLINTYRISPSYLFDFQEEAEKDKSENTRFFARFLISLKAQYSLKEEDAVWEECTIIDFSSTGIGVEFNKPVSLDSTIHLAIHLPKESEPFSVKGRLKWIKQSKNRFIGGIELTEIFDENKTFAILRAGR
jgi:transcriptional regulator with XRE-family HTH domain